MGLLISLCTLPLAGAPLDALAGLVFVSCVQGGRDIYMGEPTS